MGNRAKLGLLALAALVGLWAPNSSLLAPSRGPVRFIAHRGVHQTFSLEGVDGETCTASRVDPIVHGLLENTLPAMRAAFEAGADAVELDVHATLDGELAVHHDATLDCRTDGHGRPEDHLLEALRGLDLGYGYTADGGASFPLRGTGVGLLVTLPEVLQALPGRAFAIHIKSNRAEDGDRVAEVLASLSEVDRARQIVYGGPDAVARVTARLPEVRTFDTGRLKRCLAGYAAVGWAGVVPEACRDTLLLVPIDVAPLLWGFPRRFEARMVRVGSEVGLAGPMTSGPSSGIDDAETLARVPRGFGGWIWTNHIERLTDRSR